jgi:hypothetical protein
MSALRKAPPRAAKPDIRIHFRLRTTFTQHLCTAKMKRPWSDLLLTCQRIFAETKGIYEVARTSYWRENIFYVNRVTTTRSTWHSAQQVVDSLHDRELNLIREVIIVCNLGFTLREWRLTPRSDNMHGWILTSPLAKNDRTHSLVGRRSGLYRVINVLS